SMGKIYVGKALDENNQATGKSAYVRNYNGVIEALNLYDNAKSKAISFNTGKVENKHFFLETENVDTSSTPVFEYRIGNDSTIYGKDSGVYKVKQDNKSGRWGLNRKIRDLYHIFSPDGKIESDNWHEYDYTRTVNETVVLNPKYQEGKILSGGGIDFNDAHVDNQDSKVIAGGVIEIAKGQLHNDEFKGSTIVTDAGRVTARYKGSECAKKVFGKCIDHYDTTKSDTSIYYKQNKSVKDLGVFAYKENVAPEFTNNGVANKGDVGDVVLNRLTQSLDKSSLYNVNPNAPKGYVIETDPRFANKQKWLSSDYMFNALRYDSNNMLKRLGDGFYELRLVNEQINQLTGRRYLDGYQNALEQYKGLMDNGIRYAKQFNLVPGVGLSKEQMAELTTDLVWMVNQEITLPSGKKLNVLTPKIYLASNRTQVTPTGSVISGDSIVGSVTKMSNEGTVLASNLVNLYGQDLENKGLVLADNVNLNAEQKLVNLGGKIVAADSLSLYGGKSVELGATSTETQSQLGRTETGNKQVDRQSELKVTGKGGELSIQSGGDITIKAANVKSAGTVDVNAKGKLLVTTEKQSSKEHYDFSDNHHYHLDKEGEVGSVIEGKDGVRLIGQEETTLRQAEVTSANGKVMVASKGGVRIEEGRDIEHLDTRNKQKSKGAFTSITEEYKHKHNYDLSKGSEIDGKSVVIYSQDGNVTVQGSDIVGDDSLTVKAKNIDIREAENRVYSDDYYSKKKSGMLGGGIGVTFGSQKQTLENDQTRLYASGSQVGSLNNNTTMVAESAYTQTASIVSAIKGDVNILAKKADIKAADDKYETNNKQTFQQKGLTIAITSPIISAIQAVQGAIESTKQVGDSKHDRVNTMAAANAGFEAYRAYQSGKKAVTDVKDFMNGEGNVDSLIGVQITYGQQKSESHTHTEGKTAAKSQVNSGGKVNIVATGAGKDSNINIEGSDISGKQGTTLMADNQVNIKAAEQNHQERSTNKSSGFNAGVAIKVSNGVAAGFTAGGNYGKGYGNGDETTYVASHVGDSQSKTVVKAGGDVTLAGSQVKGKGVELDAENLKIESLQDKSSYHGKQMNVSASVTVGYGFAAGGSFNKSKVNTDYASVNEQAGIFAGNDGYDINVKNKVSSVGGAIISSAEKEKNQMTAQDFEYSNIQNYSNAKSSAMGLMGGFSVDRDQTSDEDKALNKIYRGEDRKGETFEQANPNKANQLPVKFGLGTNDVHSTDLYAAAKIGLANLASNSSQSENNQSTTNAVISDGNFNIASMQGKQNIETIKKSTEQDANKLEKVDHAELQKEVEQDVATIQSFAKNVGGATDEAYRTMFIAEHRMFTHKVDEKGKPIEDPEILKKINEEADAKGVSRKDYLQEQLDKGRNIYQLHELSDQERNQLQKVTYTDPKTGKTESKYVVAFNGIFNDHNAAAKFAVQNYIAGTDDKTGNINKKVYKDVYFVHHPEAKNGLSELLVAGYEKMFETSFGNLLGMDNSSLQAMNIMKQYGKDDLYLGSHSRGTLTLSNALKALNTEDNRAKKLLSGTTIKMVGPAADVTRADGYLSQLQTGKERTASDGSIRIENHASDPVGSMPILLGGNPATTSENNLNKSWLQRIADIFSHERSSVHNCHGLGQRQCITDGYRTEGDLKMGNEKTIFNLNKSKGE
ncbi:hemagglutinin repeat-containing protein, partial [Haemophilus sp. HMSC066D02]|uniref:hemagglutinin repeat-containing protein n=2 Tax=unclassified Haemophilus TaxID=2609962 RepID=UPI000AC06DC2